MELALARTYDATPAPKLVVAVGDCGCDGGIFGDELRDAAAASRTSSPVDVAVPGCPPRADRDPARHPDGGAPRPARTRGVRRAARPEAGGSPAAGALRRHGLRYPRRRERGHAWDISTNSNARPTRPGPATRSTLAALERNSLVTDGACQAAFRYLASLAQQLNVLQPVSKAVYRFDSKNTFRNLKMSDFRCDSRQRKNRNAEVFDHVVLGFDLKTGTRVTIAKDFPPEIEKLEARLTPVRRPVLRARS